MANREQADLALQKHQETLLENPNVAYISTVPKNEGETDGEFVIEVGLTEQELEIDVGASSHEGYLYDHQNSPKIPSRLVVPLRANTTAADARHVEQTVEVRIVVCGDVEISSFTGRLRPARGGNSCGNPRRNAAGTLGMAFQMDGSVYILSNWHVLYGNGGATGDPIIQQGRLDGGRVPADIIAHNRIGWLDCHRDAAVASVRAPWNTFVAAGTRCFGPLAGFSAAENNMDVKKCGRTTRSTSGVVRSTNTTVRVGGFPNGSRVFNDQILLTGMSEKGDSGSVILEQKRNEVVGLLFADSTSSTFANKIERIFNVGGRSKAYGEEIMPEPTLEFPK